MEGVYLLRGWMLSGARAHANAIIGGCSLHTFCLSGCSASRICSLTEQHIKNAALTTYAMGHYSTVAWL